jgi:CO/xanthine dehydrogenase FAD-binding subunit
MRNFNYLAPKSLPEAHEIIARFPEETYFIAGGTDLMIQMRSQLVAPKCVVDLKKLDLNYIKQTGQGLAIGATTTLHEIESSPLIKDKCPVLAATCSDMASYTVRHLATIGGNLCNAAPSADTAPPLIVLEAKVKMNGPDGQRIISVEDMFTGPGESVLKRGEILTEIEIPKLPANAGAIYLKSKRSEGMDLALVGVAVCLVVDGSGKKCKEVRIALGAVAPTPIRVPAAEKVLRGNALDDDLFEKAGIRAKEAAQPIDDVRASSEYREALVQVLTRDALKRAYDAISSE